MFKIALTLEYCSKTEEKLLPLKTNYILFNMRDENYKIN